MTSKNLMKELTLLIMQMIFIITKLPIEEFNALRYINLFN